MFVILLADGGASLEDLDNFLSFKVIIDADHESTEAALGRIGHADGQYVWVSASWLRENGRPADPAWLAGLDKMLNYAKRSGWLNDSGAVRAHVENN